MRTDGSGAGLRSTLRDGAGVEGDAPGGDAAAGSSDIVAPGTTARGSSSASTAQPETTTIAARPMTVSFTCWPDTIEPRRGWAVATEAMAR